MFGGRKQTKTKKLEGSVDHIIYRDYIANQRSFIYCSLARALLARYCLTSENYRRKLRAVKRKDEKTFARFFAPSETYHFRWLKLRDKERSYEGLVHLLHKLLIGSVFWLADSNNKESASQNTQDLSLTSKS